MLHRTCRRLLGAQAGGDAKDDAEDVEKRFRSLVLASHHVHQGKVAWRALTWWVEERVACRPHLLVAARRRSISAKAATGIDLPAGTYPSVLGGT